MQKFEKDEKIQSKRCKANRGGSPNQLEEYKSKLVVFPKKRLSKVKNGDSTPEECKAATQLRGTIIPLAMPSKEIVMADIPKQEVKAYTQMQIAKMETRVAGYRIAVANRKEK